jgi:thiamine biosynthesis lipoprotein
MATVPDSVRRAKSLLGTFVEITILDATPVNADDAIEQAFDAIARVHRLMSFHDPDSDVSRLNSQAASEAVTVDPWTYQVLEASIDFHRRSAGAFDIAVAPILQQLGLLPHHDRERYSPSADGQIIGIIELLPGNGVRFQHSAIRIDLGGIAKGYAVDRAVETLKGLGMRCGLVNAGGDLAGFGPNTHVVDIRDPGSPGRVMSRVAICDQALASTAGRFDPSESLAVPGLAVIDPTTLQRVDTFLGATVRANSCMTADALTKIVMLASEASPSILQHYEAAAMLVHRDGAVRVTDNW